MNSRSNVSSNVNGMKSRTHAANMVNGMNQKIKALALLAALAAPPFAGAVQKDVVSPALVTAEKPRGTPGASAGKVLFTLGRVDIQRDGAVLPATRGMPVQAGDQMDLGPTSRTQIRMNDGAMIALQPGSSFVIEEYQLPDSVVAALAQVQAAPAPAPAAPTRVATPASDSAARIGGRALFSLLKGGFRTITGLIGKSDQDVYQLKTPIATIGIRGTTYSATYCAGNCGSAPSGLYVGVSSGKVMVTNNTGTLPLNDDQYAYVQDADAPPEKTLEPPADVLDPPIEDTGEEDDSGDGGDAPGAGTDGGDDSSQFADAGADGDGDASPAGADGDTLSPADPVESKPPEVPGADPVVLPARFVAHSPAPLLGADEFAGVALNDTSEISVNAAGDLLAFRGATPQGLADYALGTAQNVNQGFDPTTALRWGRWSTGAAQVGAGSLDLSNQSLHWIIGPETFEQPVLPVTGTASYQLVGNTNPTDNLGNIGVLGSAQFSANFTNQTVSSSLSLGINNQVWSASCNDCGSIITGFPAFAGVYGSVSVDGQTNGTGSFGGFFTGPPGGGVPTGAGLGYSLNSGSTTVSGAAVFGNPGAQ